MKRKRGSGRRKPKKPLEAGANKASLNPLSMTDEGYSHCGDLENDARMEDETAPAHATVRDQGAGLQDPLFSQKGNGGNSAYDRNPLKNVASFAAKLSRAGGSSSTGPCPSARPLQVESIHVHQDLQYNEKELTAAMSVIKKIIKMDVAKPFNVPVDPVALGIPDYFNVIDTPMDFGTISNNLELGLKYKNSKDVLKDVEVIWDNCVKYNKKGDHILELMKRVKMNFIKLWTAAGLSWDQQETSNVHLERNPPHDTGYTMKQNKYGHLYPAGSMTSNAVHQEQADLMGRCHVVPKQLSSCCSYACHPHQISSQCQCQWSSRELQSCQPQRSSHIAADESTMGHNLYTHMRPGFPFSGKHCSQWQDEISPQEELSHQPSPSCSLQCYPYKKACQYKSSTCHIRPSLQQACLNTQSGGSLQSPTDGALSSSTHNKNKHVCTSSQMTGNANHQKLYQMCSSGINGHRPTLMCADQYQPRQKSCECHSNSSEYRGSEPDVTNDCNAGHPHVNLPMESAMRCTKCKLEYSPVAGVHSHEHQCQVGPSQLQASSVIHICSQPRGKNCQCQLDLGPPEPSLLQEGSNIGGAGCSHTPPLTESTVRHTTFRFEPSFALVAGGCSHQQECQGPSQSKSPSLDHSSSHEPEENGPCSQPSSSPPEPSQPEAEANICNGDSTALERKSRGRGPTRCLNLLREGKRISITTNELGQPVGLEAPKLTSFLGTLARNGHLAPLTYIDWRAVPEANKENMWEQVQTKFEIDTISKSWVLKSLGKKWKDWKSKLKTAHYITHATDEERLADRDDRVRPDQWAYLVSHWSSEEAEKRSATNKANRAQQKFGHVTGTKSFARIREEQRAKRPDGKAPSRAELFMLTRIRKDGRPLNEASSTVITQLREIASQQQDTSQNSTAQDEAFSQVVGRDRHGRIRCYGLGPSPSDFGGTKHTNTEAMKMVSDANAEVRQMKERLVAMEQTCAQMAAQMATMMSMMSSMQKNVPESVPDLVPVNSVTSEGLREQQLHSMPLRRSSRRGKI